MYNDAFSRLHPITFFGYFILLFASGAFTMDPIVISLSLLGAACFALKISGLKVLRKSVFLLIPIMIAIAFNALFNHRGVTVLAELPSGNPLTLEALIYGTASAGMICSLMIWLYCFGRLYSSDRLLCLTGRVFPSLTIVISMTIRFIPLFVIRFRETRDAQAQLGYSVSKGSLRHRVKSLARIFSVLISRSLEGSVMTADSMKSRGYGLPGRTSCDMYHFRVTDTVLVIIMLALGVTVIAGNIAGFTEYRYYPAFFHSGIGVRSLVIYVCFAALCLLPTVYDVLEDRRWSSSVSDL